MSPLAHVTVAELGPAAALFLAGAVCGALALWVCTRLARQR